LLLRDRISIQTARRFCRVVAGRQFRKAKHYGAEQALLVLSTTLRLAGVPADRPLSSTYSLDEGDRRLSRRRWQLPQRLCRNIAPAYRRSFGCQAMGAARRLVGRPFRVRRFDQPITPLLKDPMKSPAPGHSEHKQSVLNSSSDSLGQKTAVFAIGRSCG
jgi:hypothetical protein